MILWDKATESDREAVKQHVVAQLSSSVAVVGVLFPRGKLDNAVTLPWTVVVTCPMNDPSNNIETAVLRSLDCRGRMDGLPGTCRQRCTNCAPIDTTRSVQKRVMEHVRRNRTSDLMHPNTPHTTVLREVTNTTVAKKIVHYKGTLTAKKAAAYRRKTGVAVANQDSQEMLLDMYTRHAGWARERWGEDSVGYQLWMDHINTMEHAQKHNGNMVGVKHSPVMIKVCLLMRSQLSKPVYNTIARMMLWPLDQTLSPYKNAMVTRTPGFMHAVVHEKSLQLATDDVNQLHKGCLSFDAMTIKSGMAFDFNSGQLMGICAGGKYHSSVAREIDYMQEVEHQIHHSDPDHSDDTEVVPLVKYHVVAYFRSIGTSQGTHCFPVATHQTNNLDGLTILKLTAPWVTALYGYGFEVVTESFDGASENRSYMHAVVNTTVATLLDPATVAMLEDYYKIDTSLKIAKRHPVTGRPVIMGAESVHVWKKLVNALEYSSLPGQQRFMGYPDDQGVPQDMSLFMLRQVWTTIDGDDAGIKHKSLKVMKKLKKEHFDKTNFSRMRVNLAVQVMSKSMADAIEQLIESSPEQHAKLPQDRDRQQYLPRWQNYGPLLEFVKHFNTFVDVCNGKKHNKKDQKVSLYSTVDKVIPDELTAILKFLAWAAEWQRRVQACPAIHKERKTWAFLPWQCWEDLQRVVLGFLCTVLCYCGEPDPAYPHRITDLRCHCQCISQDRVENHFSHVRNQNAHPYAHEAQRSTCQAGSIRVRNLKGNSGHSPHDRIWKMHPKERALKLLRGSTVPVPAKLRKPRIHDDGDASV
eukprot:m.209190 g.209190  ORF g.209190 m.209190 type:complete len:806 (-) comp18970_c0_seq8:363-2780(-)